MNEIDKTQLLYHELVLLKKEGRKNCPVCDTPFSYDYMDRYCTNCGKSTLATSCANCHYADGVGGCDTYDLSRDGRKCARYESHVYTYTKDMRKL